MVAASSSEAGMDRIYCRAKKMFIAPPPKIAGTIKGSGVFTHCIRTYRTYSGICTAIAGSIIVDKTTAKQNSFPLN